VGTHSPAPMPLTPVEMREFQESICLPPLDLEVARARIITPLPDLRQEDHSWLPTVRESLNETRGPENLDPAMTLTWILLAHPEILARNPKFDSPHSCNKKFPFLGFRLLVAPRRAECIMTSGLA
jgi:hypothetical protein